MSEPIRKEYHNLSDKRRAEGEDVFEHEWSQDDLAVWASFTLPTSVALGDVKVQIAPLSISVGIIGFRYPIIQGNIYERIVPRDVEWSDAATELGVRVTLKLLKLDFGVTWPTFLKATSSITLDPWSEYTIGRSKKDDSMMRSAATKGVVPAMIWMYRLTNELIWIQRASEAGDPSSCLIVARAQDQPAIKLAYYLHAIKSSGVLPCSVDREKRSEGRGEAVGIFCKACFESGVLLFQSAQQGYEPRSFWQMASLFGHGPSLYNLAVDYLRLGDVRRAVTCFWMSGKRCPDLKIHLLVQRLASEKRTRDPKDSPEWNWLSEEWEQSWRAFWESDCCRRGDVAEAVSGRASKGLVHAFPSLDTLPGATQLLSTVLAATAMVAAGCFVAAKSHRRVLL